MKVLLNATRMPQVYFGLHMVEGVAQYAEHDNERIYVPESVCKKMDPSFKGRPVYVNHVDQVNLQNLQAEADGYVIQSFFNEYDGRHWVKFIVVSDEGDEAIRKGWKLSNAYAPNFGGGSGECHGVPYDREVVDGEYEHLAIVQNPRYQESMVLTEDQFKKYNEAKKAEMTRLANSKKETPKMGLSLFKRTKVDNSSDLENMSVLLPKTKKEMTITQLVNAMDEKMEKEKDQMANSDHHVMFGEKKMKVGDLVNAHQELCNKMAEMENGGAGDDSADEDAEAANDESESGDMGEMSDGDLEMNESDEDVEADEKVEKKADKGVGADKKMNAKQKIADEKALADARALIKKNDLEKARANKRKNSQLGDRTFFDDLKNAPNTVLQNEAPLDLSGDKIARGQSKYGSN